MLKLSHPCIFHPVLSKGGPIPAWKWGQVEQEWLCDKWPQLTKLHEVWLYVRDDHKIHTILLYSCSTLIYSHIKGSLFQQLCILQDIIINNIFWCRNGKNAFRKEVSKGEKKFKLEIYHHVNSIRMTRHWKFRCTVVNWCFFTIKKKTGTIWDERNTKNYHLT